MPEGNSTPLKNQREDLPTFSPLAWAGRVQFQNQGFESPEHRRSHPRPPPPRGQNLLVPGRGGQGDALAQPAPERSPSTTPHRNLRAPPAAPDTAAPPAPAGLSSPGAGVAGGSNDAPAEVAGLALSSFSRSSSAAGLSFCTIFLPPTAATSTGPPRPPRAGPPAQSPGQGLGSRRSALRLLPFPLCPSPSPSAGTRMPG